MQIHSKILSLKLLLPLLASVLLIANCENIPIRSQTKSTPERQNKLKNKTENLNDLQWKNRIILVKELDDAGIKQLREAEAEIKDREILWFRLSGGKVETNFDGDLSEEFAEYLENEYFKKFDANAFLLGKDGGIKSKDEKLNLKNYFGHIDSMPMRQREMREKN